MKNLTLNIKKNGAEPEGITVGEKTQRTKLEDKNLKQKYRRQQIFTDQSSM